MKIDEIIACIRQTMDEKKITLYKISRLTGLTNLYNTTLCKKNEAQLSKHSKKKDIYPNVSSLIEICRVLDLEIIVKPIKHNKNGTV